MPQTCSSAASLLISAAAMVVAWLGPAAAAAAQDEPMPLGASTTAPAGFLDLCRRSPDVCAEQGVEPTEVWSQARQLFWAGVFDSPSSEPAAVLAPAERDRSERRPVLFRALASSSRNRSWTPPRRSGQAWPPGAAAALQDEASVKLDLTAKDRDRIDRLNRELNRNIRQMSDQRQYGVSDHWAEPGGRAPRGDCEDYVLAKRRALIDQGYPPTAFSIALVVTPWGEDHAVLLMATTEGEVVLDNLTPRIMAWNRTDYTWVKRQAPGRSLAWTRIG